MPWKPVQISILERYLYRPLLWFLSTFTIPGGLDFERPMDKAVLDMQKYGEFGYGPKGTGGPSWSEIMNPEQDRLSKLKDSMSAAFESMDNFLKSVDAKIQAMVDSAKAWVVNKWTSVVGWFKRLQQEHADLAEEQRRKHSFLVADFDFEDRRAGGYSHEWVGSNEDAGTE